MNLMIVLILIFVIVIVVLLSSVVGLLKKINDKLKDKDNEKEK